MEISQQISEHQLCICRNAYGQFCNINGPLQPLTNLPSYIRALYAKTQQALT